MLWAAFSSTEATGGHEVDMPYNFPHVLQIRDVFLFFLKHDIFLRTSTFILAEPLSKDRKSTGLLEDNAEVPRRQLKAQVAEWKTSVFWAKMRTKIYLIFSIVA